MTRRKLPARNAGEAPEYNTVDATLWYGALAAMAVFTKLVGRPGTPWESEAERVATGFGRFWNERHGYCYDVLDTPSGHDDTLRPNQLLAVASTVRSHTIASDGSSRRTRGRS